MSQLRHYRLTSSSAYGRNLFATLAQQRSVVKVELKWALAAVLFAYLLAGNIGDSCRMLAVALGIGARVGSCGCIVCGDSFTPP